MRYKKTPHSEYPDLELVDIKSGSVILAARTVDTEKGREHFLV
ncbi:hypothetical protein phi1422_0016 [Bdellovibrio phage phi1422]|nr:hypothetical protein F395_gp16 [Bdellovibrio phage phi1422]AFC22536.1 hypothetical protein phi1422_0016 [Bdellovibrio phage phi1422]